MTIQDQLLQAEAKEKGIVTLKDIGGESQIKTWQGDITRLDVDVIVNVQGDEPLIEPSLIDDLISLFNDDADLQMATVSTELKEEAEINRFF
mgnify:CR=1 FL=1